MELKATTLVLGTIAIASVCPRGSSVVETVDTVAPVLESARLYYTDSPAFTQHARTIIRDAATWASTWTQATSGQAVPPARPNVNFESEMVILVAAGRMNTGDEIRADSTGVRGDIYVVVVRTVKGCERFEAEVYPLEIVRVRREDFPVHWEERTANAAHCM